MTFNEYRKLFSDLYEAVKSVHAGSARPHRGHGLDHDVTVAMLGVLISPDARTAEKSFCAGMLHSTDRIVERTELVSALRSLLDRLPEGHFTPEEAEEIFLSVLRHEEPRDDDSLVQQVLMDADRLANVMLSGALRAAQWFYDRPVIEFGYLDGKRNPETTWNSPCSVLDGVRVVYQMLHPLRTPKAIELRDKFVRDLSAFVGRVEEQYRLLGLAGIAL